MSNTSQQSNNIGCGAMLLIAVLISFLSKCVGELTGGSAKYTPSTEITAPATNAVNNVKASENSNLNEEQKVDACKQTIALLFGRKKSIMKARIIEPNLIRVEYLRPDDGKRWKNECAFEGNKIIWRGVDIFKPNGGPGRWRTDALDENVTWRNEDGKIKVKVTYTDGTVIE